MTKSIDINRRLWGRRLALKTFGVLGAGVAVGCGSEDTDSDGVASALGSDLDDLACVLTPAIDQGPFFVDERLNRSDLLAGETAAGVVGGSLLMLELGVYSVQAQACSPLVGAQVDIWHADVNGLYSDTASGFIQATDTRGQSFLRGYQTVDSDGLVRFKTIYPGWYATRTIHIHAKIRLFSESGDARFEAVTQIFFDDAVTDELFAGTEYDARGPRSIPSNEQDQLFNGTGPGRAIDLVGPPAGQPRPGSGALARLSRTMIDGKAGHLARMKIGVQNG